MRIVKVTPRTTTTVAANDPDYYAIEGGVFLMRVNELGSDRVRYRVHLTPREVHRLVGQVPAVRISDYFGGDGVKAMKFMADLAAILDVDVEE